MWGLKLLGFFLVITFLWWFGALVLEFQGAVDRGMARTQSYLSWIVSLELLPTRAKEVMASFQAFLPQEFDVSATGTNSTDMLLYWAVWAVTAIVLYALAAVILGRLFRLNSDGGSGTSSPSKPTPAFSPETQTSVPWMPLIVLGVLVALVVIPMVL